VISGRENGPARAGSADRAWMSGFLARSRERRLPREVLRLHDIIASSGGIEWAHQAAAAFAEAAAREFDSSAFAGVPASPDLEGSTVAWTTLYAGTCNGRYTALLGCLASRRPRALKYPAERGCNAVG
jgi:hypothetical protein